MESSSPPTILILGLDREVYNTDLLNALRSRAEVITASTKAEALSFLAESTPRAVLVTDTALARGEYRDVCDLLCGYVQRGGIVIMCCSFSSFISATDFNSWIRQRWGFGWTFGDYHRTDFHLNPTAESVCRKPGLLPAYSMKAVSLKGVDEKSKVYQPTASSITQSRVFSPEHVGDLTQAAVVYQKVDQGWLGYVGDVNYEVGSTAVILALCGLTDDACCFACHAGADGVDMPLMKCARCRDAMYCSRKCQRDDWKRHKVVCVAPAAAG